MSVRALVVEDESSIRDLIRFAIESDDLEVLDAANTYEAHRLLNEDSVDIAIVDWMLPGGSGLEFVRKLRREEATAVLPIIMLTARTEEQDIAAGLDAGADDYLIKPFSPRELQARIRALLRRSRDFSQQEEYRVGQLIVDVTRHRITVGEHEVNLGHTEFRLLTCLAKRPERVYSRAQLLDMVWGPGAYIEERTVDVHVLRIRKALKQCGADGLLQTVRGSGYRLSED